MRKCNICKKTKPKSEFHKNITKTDGYSYNCKNCKNKRAKKYYKENKEKINKRRSKYIKNRLEKDILFKLQCNLRSRISSAFKVSYWTKTSTTKHMLGEEYEVVHKHIEDQFTDGMTWDNYGIKGWHIDHIIPLASATTEEELIKLCHYTNLQPLWAEDNLKKGDKINYKENL